MNNSLGKSAKLKKDKIKTIYSAFTQFGGSDNIGYILFKRWPLLKVGSLDSCRLHENHGVILTPD